MTLLSPNEVRTLQADVYALGAAAYLHGARPEANPYRDVFHNEWNIGYRVTAELYNKAETGGTPRSCG